MTVGQPALDLTLISNGFDHRPNQVYLAVDGSVRHQHPNGLPQVWMLMTGDGCFRLSSCRSSRFLRMQLGLL